MTDHGYELDQANRPDDWWDRLQQAAYDEARAVVEQRLHGQPLEQTKVFAEAEQLKTEMAANGAFDSFDAWLAQVDKLPEISVYLPDDVTIDTPISARAVDWETEARRELDSLPPLSSEFIRTPEAEAASARLLFGPEGNHGPKLGDNALDAAALDRMEAEFADLIAQLAAEVDFREPQPSAPPARHAPDLDF